MDENYDWDPCGGMNSLSLQAAAATSRTRNWVHDAANTSFTMNYPGNPEFPMGSCNQVSRNPEYSGVSRNIDFWNPCSTRNFDDDGKEYVEKYQAEIEALIEKISLRSLKGEVFAPRTMPTVSIDGTTVETVKAQDDVYKTFNMLNRTTIPESLAVYNSREEIINGIKAHQVVVIEGFTGSGKTTQVPQYILDDLAMNQRHGRIVVTQPRRIAAQSVAERVCRERGWNLGDLVGYQVGLKRNISPYTRLSYVTTGVLLQTLISRKTLKDYSHIIIDEVHERDLDTDLLILVIKKLMLQCGDRTTRVILMSATLNAEKFANYFPRWRNGTEHEEAIIIRIKPTRCHDVQVHYLDKLQKIFGREFSHGSSVGQQMNEEPALHSPVYDTAIFILEALDRFEAGNSAKTQGAHGRGGVLVFLPGLMEIDTMFKKTFEFSEKSLKMDNHALNWDLIPLHSSITTEEQQRAFHPSRAGYRKIILATNIAESSITVTDISYVIDFCLTKSISCDPVTNYSCLRMEWASQDQCTQRRGRVGRIGLGYVFRMISNLHYYQLQKEAVPDMEKACLENVILSVKTLNLGSPLSIMALAIDPPAMSAIKLAICNLKEVGALTIDVNGQYTAYDGELTEMGLIMSKLPFDVRFSRLVALGYVFGCLEEAIIIACGLSIKTPFSFPFQKRLSAFMSKLVWSKESFSDCFAIINLYRTWHSKESAGELKGKDKLRAWKNTYFVQTNVLREVKICIEDVIRRLNKLNIKVNEWRMNWSELTAEQGLILKIVMAGAFYPNYFVRFRPDARDYSRQLIKELNAFDPFRTLAYNGFPQEQPGKLYAYNIAQHYETGNSVPFVTVSGAKVLVQFDKRSDKVGPLSINLFRGIKMRMLKNHIYFRSTRCDISRALESYEEEEVTRMIQIPCPKQFKLPPITDRFILVTVLSVTSPESFWIIFKPMASIIGDMLGTLMDFAGECRPMEVDSLIPGSLCLVKHLNRYERARIEYKKTDESNVMLFLIDLGHTVWKLPSECLGVSDELLRENVLDYPAFAIECRIHGIQPLPEYSGVWGEDTLPYMLDYISFNMNDVILEIHSVVGSVIACDLIGGNKDGTGREIGLRAFLLEKGVTLAKEESNANQENHNIRRNITFVNFTPEEIKRYNDAQVLDEPRPILLNPPNVGSCTHEHCLKGPFSPLEMSFRSLSRSANSKSVTIEGCSVNSVALDQAPTSYTGRLLIAGGVAISQRSGSVIARETTLMPPIPGLIGLLTMLFSPSVQLRAEFERYTGCLSGLGRDFTTKRAIYRDHDMEIVFDILVDLEDVQLVNTIRRKMNFLLRGSEIPASELKVLQNYIREDVKRLLQRNRETVEEIYPRKEFEWRDEKNPINISENKASGVKTLSLSPQRCDVFPLHTIPDAMNTEGSDNRHVANTGRVSRNPGKYSH